VTIPQNINTEAENGIDQVHLPRLDISLHAPGFEPTLTFPLIPLDLVPVGVYEKNEERLGVSGHGCRRRPNLFFVEPNNADISSWTSKNEV